MAPMKAVMSLAAAAALALFAPPAQARTLPPRDECAADPGFARFRAELLDIAARHDATRLLAIVTDDISFSFGGGEGRADFVEAWHLADPDSSGIWVELARVLVSGCARDGETMVAPYIFRRFPEELDAFAAGVAAPGTLLYRTRSNEGDSTPISWEILEEAAPDGAGWARVRLSDGRTGYIESANLLSAIDYRAIFEKRGGQWRMTAFIAGD